MYRLLSFVACYAGSASGNAGGGAPIRALSHLCRGVRGPTRTLGGSSTPRLLKKGNAMAFSAESVIELRDAFDSRVAARRAARDRSAQASTLIQAAVSYENALSAMAEDLQAEGHELPPVLDESTLEFVKQIATAWQAAPSDELRAMHDQLAAALVLKDSIGLTDEDAVTIGTSIAAYKATTTASDRPRREASGNGGKGVSVRARSLGRPLFVDMTKADGTAGRGIRSGERNGSGDWGSVRYELKLRVEEDGASWASVLPELVGIDQALVDVDDGKAPSFEKSITDDHGNVYHIRY